MAVTVIDPEENRQRNRALLLQAAQMQRETMQHEQLLKQKRAEAILAQRAAQRQSQLDAAKLALSSEKVNVEKAKYGLERSRTATLNRQRMSQSRLNESLAGAYKNMSGAPNGFLGLPTDNQTSSSPNQFDQDDYMVKTEVRNFRGIPQVVQVPALKPELAQKTKDEIKFIQKATNEMYGNLKLLTPKIEKFMRPYDPRAKKGGIGSFILDLQAITDKDANAFKNFKAETDKVFQAFRKQTTGAQAPFAELAWLVEDFPKPDEDPKSYVKKAIESIKRVVDYEQGILKTEGEAGRRVSSHKKGSLLNKKEIQSLLEGDEESFLQSQRGSNKDLDNLFEGL